MIDGAEIISNFFRSTKGVGIRWRTVENDSEIARRNCLTMATKRVVDAVSVGADQVICPCGNAIELDEDSEASEHIEHGDMLYVPRLVAIDCPRCGAEVQLDRFLKDLQQWAN